MEEQENPIANGTGWLQPTCEAKEWRPSRVDSLREYEIVIRFLSIGCLITVGCKQIPFATIADGMKALADYVNNPYDSRKLWEERINKVQ